jgi:hypothetical protein
LRFDHKHLHNIYIFLLPSFHSPWIIVTVINYIGNKMNSIAIRFLCVVISTVGGRSGLLFFVLPIMEGLGFFYLATISTIGGGIYLCFDHKHFHNNVFFLLPSFHNHVATSTFTIICFSCYLLFTTLELLWQSLITLTIKGIQLLFIFLCCHKYSRWSGWAHFFLVIIITIMKGLNFFSCYHKYNRWWDLFAFSFVMQWWKGAIGL